MPDLSSLPSTEPLTPKSVVDGRVDDGRREAILAASAEVASQHRDEVTLAVRTFGAGNLVLAIGGAVDAAALTRLHDLLHDPAIRVLSNTELVLDLSHLRSCERGLLRLLHQLRDLRLAEGCHVELYEPNQAFGPQLEAATLAEAFTVFDAVRRGSTSRQP